MIEVKKSFTGGKLQDGFEVQKELNKISSESYILFDEGSGSESNSVE